MHEKERGVLGRPFWRSLWPTLVVALLLSACGQRAHIRPLAPDALVLAFGDSITSGAGAGPGESYPDVLAGLLGRTVVNAGIPGDTTDGGLARLPALLEEHRPALVILCLGGNDMLAHAADAAIDDNLRATISAIRASGADVILVGVPRPGLVLSTAGFYEDLAREFKIPCECEAVAGILSRSPTRSTPTPPATAKWPRPWQLKFARRYRRGSAAA
jgi:hypothetical protein